MGGNGAIFGKMLGIPPISSSPGVDSIGLIESREGRFAGSVVFIVLQITQNKIDIDMLPLEKRTKRERPPGG
jgi:hypothetical protein